MKNRFLQINLLAVILGFMVVTLGAYTRLSDAGLGCPDWPGCYGHIGVPSSLEDIKRAKIKFPDATVEPAKGWKEMTHRYFAGTLGLLILLLTFVSWRMRQTMKWEFKVSLFLCLLVVFQAALGMWTVTEKLQPLIVTAHLLFGFATLATLWILYYRSKERNHSSHGSKGLRRLLFIALIVLVVQIALGGWTGSNYAAIICTEFPTCNQGKFFPDADFKEAFILWRELGPNYEFGKLEPAARIAIHMTHRVGALITFLLLLTICLWLFMKYPRSRVTALALLAALAVQITLGITVVLKAKPLFIAVAHNGVGVILLIIIMTLLMQNRDKKRIG